MTILGVESAMKLARDLTTEAVGVLNIFGDDAWFLEELASKLLYREN